MITTTPEHPFYARGRGFVPAGELAKGMHILEADGGYGEVEGFTLERHTQRMFNLTVDEAHTFFVGERQLLVHNACAGVITGYTPHGLNQAISRDNHGVSVSAMNDAVQNPLQVEEDQRRGTTMYVGSNAVVVLNQQGRVVTTWATNRAGWRYP